MKQLTAVLLVLVLLSSAAMLATTRRHTHGQGGELLTQFEYLDHIWFTCTGLLLLWASLGGGSFRARLAGASTCFIGLLVLMQVFGEWPGYWAILERTAYEVATVVLVFLIVACAGVRVCIARPLGSAGESVPPNRVRWTVRDLLAGIAAMALLLAVIRNLRPVSVQWSFLMCVRLVEGVLFALIAFAAAWVSLGNVGIFYRIVGFLGVVSFLIVAEGFSIRSFFRLWVGPTYPFSWQSDLPGWSEWLGLQGLLMAASLWIFRAYGYRLIWSRTRPTGQP
jgi:hypothetical protein